MFDSGLFLCVFLQGDARSVKGSESMIVLHACQKFLI